VETHTPRQQTAEGRNALHVVSRTRCDAVDQFRCADMPMAGRSLS